MPSGDTVNAAANPEMLILTADARLVMVGAGRETGSVGKVEIDPDALLLSLATQTGTGGFRVLMKLGIGEHLLRSKLGPLPPPDTLPPKRDILLGERTRCVLAMSLREAERLGHNYIDTVHLLLGIAAEGSGRRGLVDAVGLNDLAVLRRHVVNLLANGAAGKP